MASVLPLQADQKNETMMWKIIQNMKLRLMENYLEILKNDNDKPENIT